jgi:hypothetical protein
VSNFGNIKSLANDRRKKEKILRLAVNSSGDRVVTLSKNKEMKFLMVKSLVFQTFSNIDLKLRPRIKHIDGNKFNNRLDNLKTDAITREPNIDVKIEDLKDKQIEKMQNYVNIILDKETVKEEPNCIKKMENLQKHIGKKAKGLEFINVEDGELTHDHIEKERNKYINKIGIIRTIDKNNFTIDFGTAYFSYPIILLNEALSIEENKSNEIKTPPYYDNSKGSLYQVATQRGWNAYLFDIVKRLERGGKKDPLKQEIEKSIAVLQLWLKELEPIKNN